MKFIINKEKYIDSKLISEKEHPTLPLLIYNYTPECQFSKTWDKVTMMCRGLIVHKYTREIVARPFTKFFNYEEHVEGGEALPNEIPYVYPKFDGSLGILYWWEDKPHIATRGSFTSDQALWASEFIDTPHVWNWIRELDRNFTHLFEIIYPENRIVVSYGNQKDLIHLASIHTETGKSIAPDSYFPSPHHIPFTSYEALKNLNDKNKEGFVLHYPQSDFRVKIKFEDYVALHKVITGLSQIGIWEMLRDGKDVFEIIRDIPDEMHGWVSGVIEKILENFILIENGATLVESQVKNLSTRKEQAEIIKKSKYPGVVFSMLDGKDYKTAIWRMIRPKGTVTFRRDIDA